MALFGAELRQSIDARGLGDHLEQAQRMADDSACWLDFRAMTSAELDQPEQS